MNLLNNKLKPGFKQLLIKTAIFVGLFLLIQIATMNITNQTKLPYNLTIPLIDLAKVGFFSLVLFFVVYREKLFKIEKSKFEIKNIILFGILETSSLIFYFKFKEFILNNLSFVDAHLLLFQILIYFILFLMLVFLALSIFGYNFIKKFIKEFKKEVGVFSLLTIILYFSSYYVQKSWYYFSTIVATAVSSLLGLISTTTLRFNDQMPIISFKDFTIGIASPCSGIESMFLFTILYLFIICFDWKIINKKRATLLFIPGLISVFLLDILRIFLLILLGADVSNDFALGVFHTNASWILFIIYFAIFWKIFYKWMKK